MRLLLCLLAASLLAGYLLRHHTSLFLALPLPGGSIFLKNALAALATLYLGALLSLAELWIYRHVSPRTYAALDRLSEPLYALLRFSALRAPSPQRACLLYLYAVPLLSLFVNLAVVSAFLWRYGAALLPLLLPHALLEVPAILASVALALRLARRMERAAAHDATHFRQELGSALGAEYALATLLILFLLYIASLLEV
ncbi:MAG: hypothetical protein GXO66_09985 [Euryarchaeota archaeon]|nr:hypothetical protein [Euryarchaeota archaeon]